MNRQSMQSRIFGVTNGGSDFVDLSAPLSQRTDVDPPPAIEFGCIQPPEVALRG